MYFILIDVEAIKVFIENLLPFLRPRNTSPPALPQRAFFALPSHLKAARSRHTVVLKTQRAIESVLRSERGNTLNLSKRSEAWDIANVDTQNSASDSEKKCRSLWLMGDDALCAAPQSLSLLFYVYDIYIVVQEKINKRDWFCSLCVGQENYCMYIYTI